MRFLVGFLLCTVLCGSYRECAGHPAVKGSGNGPGNIGNPNGLTSLDTSSDSSESSESSESTESTESSEQVSQAPQSSQDSHDPGSAKKEGILRSLLVTGEEDLENAMTRVTSFPIKLVKYIFKLVGLVVRDVTYPLRAYLNVLFGPYKLFLSAFSIPLKFILSVGRTVFGNKAMVGVTHKGDYRIARSTDEGEIRTYAKNLIEALQALESLGVNWCRSLISGNAGFRSPSSAALELIWKFLRDRGLPWLDSALNSMLDSHSVPQQLIPLIRNFDLFYQMGRTMGWLR